MEYACAVWHGSLREDIALSLERIQASVARRLLRADWFTPTETLLEQLGWPALRWRREISSLTLFHKLLHSRPEPLRELFFPFAHTTSSRCRRKPLQLLLPQARTTRYRNPFSIALPFSGTLSHKTFKHTPTAPHSGKPLNSTGQHTDTQPNKTFPYHSLLPSLNYLTIYTTYTPIAFLCNINFCMSSLLQHLSLHIYSNM